MRNVATESASCGSAIITGPWSRSSLSTISSRRTTSLIRFTVRIVKETSYEEICAAMKRASKTYLKDILACRGDEVVPTDFIHDSHPGIFDAGSGMGLNSRFFKLVSWYDNEWGCSNRCVDLIRYIAGK